ncbi:G-protein coupled receptor 6 [Centropristis striata]|uniref:G-protein coupled receptor 6 n=1 Tax=Centropristis striata TaxID=184440 RepID=UPI0027E1A723|nr:G-protein coupled receptor 6 [Centropristis striata]
MNESLVVNDSFAAPVAGEALPWMEADFPERNSSLEFSTAPLDFPINPWDIMLCMSGTVIACENAIVVAIIFYTPTLRTPMFVLIGSLATADLLAGMGLILNFVFQYVISSETISLITVGFLVASFTASISSLLAITVDRYFSLYNALTYFSEKTLQYVHLMLVGTWGVSLFLGLLPVLGWNCLDDPDSCSIVRPLTRSNVTLLAASFFVIFVLMLTLYFKICKIVCHHAHQIALQQHFFATSHYVATKKGVSTLAIILGTFGASWLPFAIYCLVGEREYPSVYTYATLLPATYNSMINPIIYAYRNAEIQRSLYVLLCGCFQANKAYRSRSPSEV